MKNMKDVKDMKEIFLGEELFLKNKNNFFLRNEFSFFFMSFIPLHALHVFL